ncbi:MAG TPA: tripartite tricarboxylate transporter substrate binding protein [Burkholderiaceae bacterium]|nr:tripartite tricarboxylate transporter substrate binding protein [Burkholderiaceae bacterium]
MLRFVAALAALCTIAPAIAAEPSAAYPDRPVHLVVPFPAGGGADSLARLIMPRVSKALGQPIVIENKPGAGGNVGAEYVARSVPDGYTLLYGTNGTHAINASLYRELRFDPFKDFIPVSRMTEIATMLVVNPQVPVKSVAELIQYARAHPGELNFGSAGNGTTSHLAGELFKTQAGIDIVHIPYRGGALAMTDLIGGQVQMMVEVMPNAYPQAREGRVRGLAVATASRFPGAPELPTIAESGLPGFEASAWDGIFVPAGTPAAIVARLNAAIRQALDDPELTAALLSRGARPAPVSTDAFARFIASSAERWASAVRSSGAKID